MIRKKNLPVSALLFAMLLYTAAPVGQLGAEALGSPEWGYSLDLPEGFALENRSGTTRYHFVHQLAPVDLQIALYPPKQFSAASDALKFVTAQFGSKGDIASFEWRRRTASIAQLSFPAKAGWSLSVELADKKGWLVMACYTDEARATELEPLIISTLDSVFSDDGAYFEAGPMTSFAWAKEKPVQVEYRDAKTNIAVPMDTVDAGANQSVVDREYQLLTAYQTSPLVYAAWKRYYRLIYRDAWGRLSKPAFLMQTVLPADPKELTAELLSWTQSFNYERDKDGSDFMNLADALARKTGDCDSRSLLLVMLLNQMGVDAILLVSPEYSHAVAAVDCPGEGARYELGGKKYLIADTTAKVGAGLIAQDMADSSKWFPVAFYAFPQPDTAEPK